MPQDGFLIADEWQVVLARQFNKRRAGDTRGDVTPFFDLQATIADSVENQSRNTDER
jgi:hypothetical protein